MRERKASGGRENHILSAVRVFCVSSSSCAPGEVWAGALQGSWLRALQTHRDWENHIP